MLNQVVIVGRLAADPEIRHTANGICVADLRVAVDRPHSFGENKKTDFFQVVAWRKTAEFVGNFLHKGRLVGITGFLILEQWETKEGEKRSMVKIQAEDVRSLEAPKDGKQETQEADDGMPF